MSTSKKQKKQHMKIGPFLEEYFTCPITHDPFTNPVLAQDGHMYERSAIERWFTTSNRSPITNNRMNTTLIPVIPVRKLMEMHRETSQTSTICWAVAIRKQASTKESLD